MIKDDLKTFGFSGKSDEPELLDLGTLKGYYKKHLQRDPHLFDELRFQGAFDRIKQHIMNNGPIDLFLVFYPLEEADTPASDKQAIIRSSVKDLTIEEVPGDGACLFSAIALHVGGMNAQELRKFAVDNMRFFKDTFRDFVSSDKEGLVQRRNRMSKPDTYGDQFEIEVIQRSLGRPIIVIQSSAPPVIPEDMRDLTGEPIFIYYDPSEMHYDALIVNEGHDARAILHNIQEEIRAGEEVTLQSTITPKTSGSQITRVIRITPQEIFRMLQLGVITRDACSSLGPGLFRMSRMSDDAIPADPAAEAARYKF